MHSNITEVMERYRRAVAARSEVDGLLTEIGRFAMPSAREFYFSGAENQTHNRHAHLRDNTLMLAIENKANMIISRLAPPGETWAHIVFGENVEMFLTPEELHRSQAALEERSGRLLKKLERSNFRAAMRMAAKIMLAFGYVSVMPRYDENKIKFVVCRPREFYMENAYGEDGAIFWRRPMTAAEIENRWGVPVSEMPTERKEVVFACLPLSFGGQRVSEIWIWEKQSNKVLAAYQQVGEPIICGAMPPASGETYPVNQGYGAMMLAPAQALNQEKDDMLTALALAVNPPMVVNEGALVDAAEIDLSPGAYNRIANGDPRTVAGNIIQETNWGVLMSHLATSQQQMKETFGRMPSEPMASPPAKTAYEVWVARERERQSYGEWTDIFRDELLIPLLKQCIVLLQIHEGWDAQMVIDDQTFRLEVSGDSESQRNATHIQRIGVLLEQLQINPAAAQVVNADAALRQIAESLSLSSLLRSPEQVQKFKELLAMKMEQQAGAGGGGGQTHAAA